MQQLMQRNAIYCTMVQPYIYIYSTNIYWMLIPLRSRRQRLYCLRSIRPRTAPFLAMPDNDKRTKDRSKPGRRDRPESNRSKSREPSKKLGRKDRRMYQHTANDEDGSDIEFGDVRRSRKRRSDSSRTDVAYISAPMTQRTCLKRDIRLAHHSTPPSMFHLRPSPQLRPLMTPYHSQ